MHAPAYDIFKQKDSHLIWIESAHDLESAKKRIEELGRNNRCEYIVFDQRRQRIVATHP